MNHIPDRRRWFDILYRGVLYDPELAHTKEQARHQAYNRWPSIRNLEEVIASEVEGQ